MRLSFGRYVPLNSVIHKMDPRFKLAMIILLIIAIFFPTGYTGYIVLSAVIFGIYALSGLSWKMLSRVFLPTSIIFLVILIINIFLMKMDQSTMAALQAGANSNGIIQGYFPAKGAGADAYISHSGDVWSGYLPWANKNDEWGIAGKFWSWDKKAKAGSWVAPTESNPAALLTIVPLGHFFRWKAVWLSERALYSAFLMAWRIFLMITLTTIITGTTQPMEITLGLEDLLTPLKWIGIPVHILATIISIALRMIPDLIDEAGRIMKAQASRGIDMKNGNPSDKFKGIVSLIIPLLVSSFQKAEDMAYAMDARDYDPHAKRTRFHQFTFNWKDLVMLLCFGAIAIGAMVYGGVGANYGWMIAHIAYLDGLAVY